MVPIDMNPILRFFTLTLEVAMKRIDPIFNLETPLLFAHRGGAREVPESTIQGFKHAIQKANVDVLELDVQLTRDGEFVVWHGPELHNVRIQGQSDRPKERERTKIYHYKWPELDGKAWVSDPDVFSVPVHDRDLSKVPSEDDRCLMRLEDFLSYFPNHHLNIEIKKSFARKINDTDRKGLKHNIKAFVDILDAAPGNRRIVVASASDDRIDAFREISEERYPTNLSILEQLTLQLFSKDMHNRVLETSYSGLVSSRRIVEKVHAAKGAVFVFLTEFGALLPAIDEEIPSQKEIFDILDRGIDGIMTDRPESVRKIMDQWKQGANAPA
jgi:glycerophosphoryl diester phosphodiesterase